MSSTRRHRALLTAFVSIALAAASGLLLKVSAYEKYESDAGVLDGCASCHELATGGFVQRGALHTAHTDSATRSCQLCHTSTGDVPFIGSAGDGVGCIGCHGQPIGGVSSGAGLRLHHARANVPADSSGQRCVSCHADDPAPPPESTVPAYYGRTDVMQTTPCNGDGREDFWSLATGTPDGRGLDNDGDLLYDAIDDPDCGASPCHDFDRDGYGDPGDPACPKGSARDCDDTRADTYPGAPEVYDTRDNSCNGEVDEIQGLGYFDPEFPLALLWSDQLPAGQLYDLIRSDSPQFPSTSALSACLALATPMTQYEDLTAVPRGRAFYYLVRNTLVADYGNASNGTPRLHTLCP
jgi:hypothetical protein